VSDKPGVLASIATVFGNCGISIASVLQREGFGHDAVPVIFLTYRALEKQLGDALKRIETMEFVKEKTRVIRIED
jgi:homoserine dehydrogenase